ncbi:SBBP repeat-containing protein [Hymenobacter busanensis]|uniref:SBBP repeat-containing protein n=1 Tax=Hymenobacter busanensis TaxID=2607656 RepID=UPI0013669682|nr:SBBP repeat-containing protein [Hymenobacter busanensis]QHJ08321.1 hypothetical protein GUY19_13880 [Hymenobacter busanensis]
MSLSAPGGATATSVFVAKYNPQGNVTWAVQGTGAGYKATVGVATDPDRNIYLAGNFNQTITFGGISITAPASALHTFLVKLNEQGVVQWVRQVASNANAVAVSTAGDVCIMGDFQSSLTIGATTLTSRGAADMFLARYDTQGNVRWAVSGGSTDMEYNQGVALDAQGNVYVTGEYTAAPTFGTLTLTMQGASDAYAVKYNPLGVPQWAQRLGGSGEETGLDLYIDATSNVYVSGIFSGGFAFASNTYTSQNNSYDVFVAKLGPTGTPLWAQAAGGAATDYAWELAGLGSNIYVVNMVSGNATFGTTTLTGRGGTDVYVSKYSSTGALQWVAQAGGNGADQGRSISLDAAGNVYVTGTFSGTAAFGGTSLPSAGGTDAYVAKLLSSVTATRPAQALPAGSLSVFPNPAHQQITLRFEAGLPAGQVTLVNTLGQQLGAWPYSGAQRDMPLPVGALAAGLYQVHYTATTGQHSTTTLQVE